MKVIVCGIFLVFVTLITAQEHNNQTKKCNDNATYHCKLERAMDIQINAELNAFYTYLEMARAFVIFLIEDLGTVFPIGRDVSTLRRCLLKKGNYFAHEDYFLPGLSKFFLDEAQEELKHAQKMIEFQTKRGVRVKFREISPNDRNNQMKLENSTAALNMALELEKSVTLNIKRVHKLAEAFDDTHLQDFLESNFIPEQYDSMKKLRDYIKTLERLTKEGNTALAEFQFDKLVMQGK
eukprot:gene10894-12051_t